MQTVLSHCHCYMILFLTNQLLLCLLPERSHVSTKSQCGSQHERLVGLPCHFIDCAISSRLCMLGIRYRQPLALSLTLVRLSPTLLSLRMAHASRTLVSGRGRRLVFATLFQRSSAHVQCRQEHMECTASVLRTHSIGEWYER